MEYYANVALGKVLEYRQLFSRKIDIKKLSDPKNGVFVINGKIDNENAYHLVKDILDFSQKYLDKLITIYIRCDGGAVAPAMAIYDVMNAIPNPISTIAVDYVGGIGTLILASGTPTYRLAYQNTKINIGSFFMRTDKKVEMEEIYASIEKILKIIEKQTDSSTVEIEKILDTTHDIDTDAAIQFGIIDKVI